MSEITKEERMHELLADSAASGLEAMDQEEFESLKREFPDLADDDSFEAAASAIAMAGVTSGENIPHNLKAKILRDADDFFDSISTGAETVQKPTIVKTGDPDTAGPGFMQWLGWAVAGVACIALVANVWFTETRTAEIAETPKVTPKAELTDSQKLDQLVASASDVVRTKWISPAKDENLSGEVVWSDAEQRGYMKFKGLAANDKQKETYQLWIFENKELEEHPKDGGVFDVTKDGEVVIPIDAKLDVKNPAAFAVTVEKPGGVVVSKREKIVALAQV